jgi:beta-ureidopropionase
MQDFRAACIQTPPGGVATPEYVDRVLAEAEDVQLVVLPELCNVPYFPLEANSLDARSPESLDGQLVSEFGALATKHECHVMLGLYLRDGASRWNSAVLLGPEGQPLHGRTSRGGTARTFNKVHLCDVQLEGASFCESAYFDAGDEYVIWDTPLGALAGLICYDRHFPDAWTSLRAMGAEVVCVCTTSPAITEPTFVAEIQAMALQQSVFVAMANRVGREVLQTSGKETHFLGSSCIVDPEGHLLAAARPHQPEAFVAADLQAERLTKVRAQHQFEEHRRPDTYVANQLAASRI